MTFSINGECILLKLQLHYENSKLYELVESMKVFPSFKFKIEEMM